MDIRPPSLISTPPSELIAEVEVLTPGEMSPQNWGLTVP